MKPTGEDVHSYVEPATAAAPSTLEPPIQIALLVPALAAGNGLTVITTVPVFAQPVAVMVSVSVYVVLTFGETLGLETFEVKPAGEDVQEYVLPETAVAPIVVALPLQTA